ncbi:MAG TPA: nickel insertion protein, partial [Candidatus Saccharimonadales bacterium]|nr:nickel insertion protein [Candidatus Saccharimonadales bacterium]
MKTLYLDIFSGISGDMFIGAMLDLGVDFHRLENELKKLPLEGYHLHSSRAKRSHIEGTKFDVHLAHDHSHSHSHPHSHGHDHPHAHEHEHGHSHEHARNYAEIKMLIARAGLSSWVKEKSTAVFHRIAVAEGKIHGLPPDQVHFHEVGAVDSIVDIVGACIA